MKEYRILFLIIVVLGILLVVISIAFDIQYRYTMSYAHNSEEHEKWLNLKQWCDTPDTRRKFGVKALHDLCHEADDMSLVEPEVIAQKDATQNYNILVHLGHGSFQLFLWVLILGIVLGVLMLLCLTNKLREENEKPPLPHQTMIPKSRWPFNNVNKKTE